VKGTHESPEERMSEKKNCSAALLLPVGFRIKERDKGLFPCLLSQVTL
jgi:hypothetical protein